MTEFNIQKNTSELQKTLTLFELICLGIGMVVGGGIFVLTGLAAGEHAGPAVTLSFAIAGLICICAGLCYAEFSSMTSMSGSTFSYINMSFGAMPAFVIGIFTIVSYFFGTVSAIVGWSSYFIDLISEFNIHLPEYLITFGLFNLPALFITIVLTLILCYGVKTSSIVTSVFVVLKLSILIIFIIIGIKYIDSNNLSPYIPKNTGEYGKFGLSGVMVGTAVVFLSFNGFDAICTAAQESKYPKTHIPISIIITILIVTLIYVSTAFVLTGIVNYKDLLISQPFTIALKVIDRRWFTYLIKIGALIGLTSVILVSLYTLARMIMFMSIEKLLPRYFSSVNTVNKVPNHTMPLGIIMSICASFLQLQHIVNLSSFLILVSLNSVCIATIYMRYQFPGLLRKFRCPYVPLIPSIAIVIIFFIMLHYPSEIYLYFLVLTIFSMIFYKLSISYVRNEGR